MPQVFITTVGAISEPAPEPVVQAYTKADASLIECNKAVATILEMIETPSPYYHITKIEVVL